MSAKRMVFCGNPHCNNKTSSYKKYCSGKCKDIARFLRSGQMMKVDNFGKYRGGSIRLINGIEIRNDAMGKEIADNHSSSMSAYYR